MNYDTNCFEIVPFDFFWQIALKIFKLIFLTLFQPQYVLLPL